MANRAVRSQSIRALPRPNVIGHPPRPGGGLNSHVRYPPRSGAAPRSARTAGRPSAAVLGDPRPDQLADERRRQGRVRLEADGALAGVVALERGPAGPDG